MDRGIAGIVLAAGFSSRMGMFKPLLPLGPSSVLERTVTRLRQGGVRDIVVVTGHRAAELRPLVAALGAREATNCQPDLGMLSSILIGVAALTETSLAAFVLPADMPMVKPSTIRLLSHVFISSGESVVRPTFRGRRGHPPLVSLACFDGSVSPQMEGGLGAVIAREKDVTDLPVLDEGILWDMDTPEEYSRMAAKISGEGIPTEAECEAILEHFGVPAAVVAHSRAVADGAVRLARSLNRAGGALDLSLVYAAGMLHDLSKARPSRDWDGMDALWQLGFDKLGSIEYWLRDWIPGLETPLSESHVVYWADQPAGGGAAAIGDRIQKLTGLSLETISSFPTESGNADQSPSAEDPAPQLLPRWADGQAGGR
jgi:molybdenum cofactor cytidylyltransferase